MKTRVKNGLFSVSTGAGLEKWWFPKGISFSGGPCSGFMLDFGRVRAPEILT